MNRRDFLRLVPAAAAIPSLSGCIVYNFAKLDLYHPYLRSELIDNPEKEKEVVSKATLTRTDDGRIRVLCLKGTPYERGYQQGYLLRQEIHDNMGFLWEKALRKFRTPELFIEIYERMEPFIHPEFKDEMHGLAHGSRMPLEVVHSIHVLADIGEWGGKKHLGKILKEMLHGELATMCSNIAASKTATVDGKMYVVRILDWGLHKISRLHEYPLIAINVPESGVPSANIGWVGYLGSISGMNAEGITLGEMGYRDPPNETLHGEPMPFMLRRVMSESRNLADVRRVIKDAVGTNSYVFMMSDGKSGEAELYVKDRDRFLVFHPGEHLQDDKEDIPAIADIVYGGRYNDTMNQQLSTNHGKVSPELLMKELIPQFAMTSNFQNVVYDPAGLKFWVSNAASATRWAAEEPYTLFDLGKALKSFGVKSGA